MTSCTPHCSLLDLSDINVLEKRVAKVLKRLERLSQETISWHIKSAISSLNIIAALYGYWICEGYKSGIERIVLISKGHCSLALYTWLAEVNIIKEEELLSFANPRSRLQAHPEAGKVPGIIASTGSLGLGLSIANGIALASKMDGVNREVAVLLGDGELDEGQIWEAAATASSLKLDNVVALVDRNMTQHSGFTEHIKIKEPLKDKWRSFGWHVIEVSNNLKDIIRGLMSADSIKGKPKVIIVYGHSFRY